MNRRTFLKTSGVLLAQQALKPFPTAILLETITQGFINRAVAEQGSSASPRKWVDLVTFGAPPTWHYTLFLKTAETDQLITNSMVANCFEKQGTDLVPIYKTVSLDHPSLPAQKVVAPWLWQFQVPKSSGGTRPMADLLKHFLTIRGVYTANAAHDGGISLHYRSPGAAQSLSAYSADPSSKPIPALSFQASNFEFASTNTKSAITVGGGNSIASLLDPFKPLSPPTTLRSRENQIQRVIDDARSVMDGANLNRNRQNRIAIEAMKKARDLMNKDFGNLQTIWDGLVKKYQDLITRSFDINLIQLRGINDQAVPYSGLETEAVKAQRAMAKLPVYESVNPHHSLQDLASRLKKNGQKIEDVIPAGTDLRELLRGATIPGMASDFALAEFVLLQDLSDSISLGGLDPRISWQGITTGFGFDQHTTGAVSGTLINSHWAVAHAACLLELIDQLDRNKMWQNTVINTSSEFIRSPRTDGSGSDHGTTMHFNLFSGCIDGPIILGNIAKEGPQAKANQGTYGGTWGEAGDQPEVGGKIKIEHAHNTIATLLGLDGSAHKFIPARQSLVKIVNGKAVPTIATGKIV